MTRINQSIVRTLRGKRAGLTSLLCSVPSAWGFSLHGIPCEQTIKIDPVMSGRGQRDVGTGLMNVIAE